MPSSSANPRRAPNVAPDAGSGVSFWLCALVPAVVAAALFVPAARNGFVWDDPLVFQQLDHFRTIGDVFAPPDAVPRFYYRPLVFLTFLIEQAFGGREPRIFHVSVIAWHVVATLLVYALGVRLLGNTQRVEASLAAFLFAVHPLHVESVAWIAGRSDVIATVFVLLAVYLASQVRHTWAAWLAGGAVLLGCWAKEVALAALVLIPARDLLLEKKLLPPRYLPLLLAAAAYFVTRYLGIGSVGGGLATQADTPQVVRDLFAAVGWYGSKLLVPINLNAYVPQVPPDPVLAILGIVCVLLGSALGIWAWRKGTPVVAFILIWMGVTLAPSLWVIVRRSASAVLAERYAYLPSVGLVWLVAWGLSRVAPPTLWRIAAGVVVGLGLLGGVHARQRIAVWADNVSFWTDVANKVPDHSLPHRELADALMAQNRLDDAESHYRIAIVAISDREGRVMAFNNLGNLYVRREQYDQAEQSYREGIDLYPHPRLYSGLGRAAIERARRAGSDAEAGRQLLAARDALTRAVAGDAEDYRSHNLLGQVLFNLGKRDEAKLHFEKSLALNPSGAIADIARQYLQQIGR